MFKVNNGLKGSDRNPIIGLYILRIRYSIPARLYMLEKPALRVKKLETKDTRSYAHLSNEFYDIINVLDRTIVTFFFCSKIKFLVTNLAFECPRFSIKLMLFSMFLEGNDRARSIVLGIF